MPNQTKRQKVFLPLARKAVGAPQYYGVALYGLSFYAQADEVFAVYQRRYTSHASARSYGSGRYGSLWFGEQRGFPRFAKNGVRRSGLRHIYMKFYRPVNPQTIPQQAWRGTFADGVAGWQSLTTLQKEEYNKRANSLQMTGYHLYLREWLQSH